MSATYFLERTSDSGEPSGYFVARSGHQYSYTRNLARHAQAYATREAAEANRCGNEIVRSIEDIVS